MKPLDLLSTVHSQASRGLQSSTHSETTPGAWHGGGGSHSTVGAGHVRGGSGQFTFAAEHDATTVGQCSFGALQCTVGFVQTMVGAGQSICKNMIFIY